MLETQLVSVNFGQGIDTKSDPKLVVAGKLLRLENAVFTKAKKLVKRNGYTLISSSIVGGGSLSAPNLVSTFKGELVCQDAGKFYAYSPSIGKWVEKGRYVSCKVTTQPISSGEYDARRSSGVKLGNYSLSAWDIGTSQVGYSIFDDVTGTRAAAEQKITANYSKSCNLGSTWMGLFYVNGSNQLAARGFNVTSSGVSTLSEVVLGSDLALNTVDALNTLPQYDCATTSAGFAVAYGYGATYGGGQSGLKVKTFDASGTLQNSATLSTASALSVCLVVDSTNGNLWVYWIENSTNKIYYAVLDSTLGTVLAKTQITAGTSPGQVVASSSSATQQAVYFTDNFASTATNGYKLKTCTVDNAGSVGSISTLHVNVDIWGKPIKVGSSTYLPVLSGPTTDQAIYLVDCSDGYVAAKTLYGKAYAPRSSGFWAVPYLFSSSKVICPAEMVNTQGFSPVGGAGPYPAASVYGFLRQAINSTFDFGHADNYQALTDGDNLVLNGAIVQAYDAQGTAELGFLCYPQVSTPSSPSTGGHLTAGTYSYIAVFQWYDAQGNLHQSAPSIPLSVTFGSGVTTGTVNLSISCLSLTQKKAAAGRADIQIAIYRTTANGTLYYQVSSLTSQTLNSATASTVSFSDTYADSVISGNNLPYTNGGVVENIPPPPAVLMCSHNNRLWLVSSEDDTLWYSKTILPTVGVSMSDLFTVQVQENFGRITGLSEMDEKLVIFKQDRPFYLAGDGANDIGGGSTLTTPQPVSADVGCSVSKSMVLIPNGLIFKSPKGIYLLDRALNVSYLGFEVEEYNAQDITSAVVCYDKNQVRLLTSSGKTLVYDYVFNQWSTFTNHTGGSACLYGGVYVYAKTGGSIFQESSTSYLDNSTSFTVLAQTAHIKMGAVQGFQRVRRMGLLGDYINGSSASHGVKMSVAYDYGTSFSTPIPYTFGAAAASGVFQYRERLPVQKCESLSILIEEVTNSVSGEFIDLTDLTLEVGIKRGINKLPAAQSVG